MHVPSLAILLKGADSDSHAVHRIIFFGVLQIIFSQIQDIDRIWALSVIATLMSFTYSGIGLGLSIALAAGLCLMLAGAQHCSDRDEAVLERSQQGTLLNFVVRMQIQHMQTAQAPLAASTPIQASKRLAYSRCTWKAL